MVVGKQPKSGRVSVTEKGGKRKGNRDSGTRVQEKTEEGEEKIARTDEWKE